MKDYSQGGEQKIILDYFQPPRWNYMVGTQLDIGANDGQTFSNSRLLALASWRSILVEPSPEAFSKLSALYADAPKADLSTGIRLVQAAIAPTDGPIDFYDCGTHLKQGDVALLSTTVPSEMDRWKKSGEQFTKTTVRGITFATLMRETGCSHFDFISIDCEGADVIVLQQIDLTAVGCQMVCVEFNQNRAAADAIREHCEKHGMKFHRGTYENLIFSRQ